MTATANPLPFPAGRPSDYRWQTSPPLMRASTCLAQACIEGHYDPTGGIAIEDGHIALPIGPGLGVTPDPDAFTQEICTF